MERPAFSDRLVSSETTFTRVAPFLAELGITRVGKQTGLDDLGIPVWFACAPNARAIVIAQGKGLTDDDARTSAAMEAVERAVAGHPHCSTIQATLADLQVQGLSCDTVDEFLAAGRQPLKPDEVVVWASARAVADSRDVYVPFDAVHLDRTRAGPRYWISSDGLASGNTYEEALLHAVLERVERDAHCLWQIGSAERRYARPINPKSLRSPEVDGLIVKIERGGLALRLFDITSDTGIPVFAALLAPEGVEHGDPMRHVEVTEGAGAHLVPARAAVRAITEAAQSRLTYIAGARDDLPPTLFSRPLGHETRAAFRSKLSDRSAAKDIDPNTDAVIPPLEIVLSRLEAAGIRRVYAVELSNANLPVSVVKVLIPDLESPEGARRLRFGSRALSAVL